MSFFFSISISIKTISLNWDLTKSKSISEDVEKQVLLFSKFSNDATFLFQANGEKLEYSASSLKLPFIYFYPSSTYTISGKQMKAFSATVPNSAARHTYISTKVNLSFIADEKTQMSLNGTYDFSFLHISPKQANYTVVFSKSNGDTITECIGDDAEVITEDKYGGEYKNCDGLVMFVPKYKGMLHITSSTSSFIYPSIDYNGWVNLPETGFKFDPPNSNGSNTGLIVGIVFLIIFLVAIGVCAYFAYRQNWFGIRDRFACLKLKNEPLLTE